MPESPQPIDQPFVHLHLHTEYSLLDGGNRIDRLVARVKELGMGAVAVTDHGNIHGAVSFYEQARAAGVKPILGVEAYVAPGDRADRTYTGVVDGGYHLVLLAENETGWANLLELCSEAYLTGFYFKPRMDHALLAELNSGLIAINGHLGSELAHHLMQYEQSKDPTHWKRAQEVARWHADVFADEGTGPRFFVEMQHHVVEQNSINPHLIRLAREMDLPLVCDNDSHFLRAEDHDAHDTLICISMGKVKDDATRLRYTPELYVKSPEEMWSIFGEGEYNNERFGDAGVEALTNTARIAERCNVELPIGANHAPVVVVRAPEKKDLPRHDDSAYAGDLSAWYGDYCARFTLEPATDPGLSQDSLKKDCDKALRMLAEAGMVWRYGPGVLDAEHDGVEGEDAAPEQGDEEWLKWARLNRELKILADKSISAYFLIVWDFVNWGRQQGIPALARGSGVGTMVGYVLGLSNACPVHYGLLFERFTDPDRSEYPDIDIDLCQDGRADVINYVREKYGHVAQIITFGTLKARAAIRDVGRVHEFPLGETDKLAKLVPEQLHITLDDALAQEPDLKKWYESDEQVRRIIDVARVIEGQARHSSVHAAGVIVATRPLHEIVPLYKQPGAEDHEIVTQWDGPTCEKMGLLKMDFLGLRTLSTIERCKALIRETLDDDAVWAAVGRGEGSGEDGARGPHPLDLDRLAYDDPRVFELFQRGETVGVFQFESGGMRRLLVDMKPDRLEDLIAANALFRPGPMDLIPDYNRRKHGHDVVPKVHEIVDGFTAETYGVMVYQEQVMQIVHELGGIPLRAAYSLIKAISKKKAKIIDANRPKFIEGAVSRGLSKREAEDLFELILKFAGYGFNKSHSTGYAIVAYQTAYLKTYFPNQYMAAFLSYESQAQKVSDWIRYVEDCRRTRFTGGKVGVEVRPPDINLSRADFSVVFDEDEQRDAQHGHVRFGLKAIKGAGGKAIEAIIEERDGDDGGSAYSSIYDFCERVPPGVVNKATIEALVKCGAFDSVHGRADRASMCASIEQAVSIGKKIAQDREAGQAQLFGFGSDEAEAKGATEEPPLVQIPRWSETETLQLEKETLGFYVSSHPLESWSSWITAFSAKTCAELSDHNVVPASERVVIGALVSSVRTLVVRSGRSAGQKMGIVTLEDLSGTIEAVVFSDQYAKYSHLLESEQPVFVIGETDHSRGDPQVKVERVLPIECSPRQPVRWLDILFDGVRLNGTCAGVMERAHAVLASALDEEPAGEAPVPRTPVRVFVKIEGSPNPVPIRMNDRLRAGVVPTRELIRELTAAVGVGNLRLTGSPLPREEQENRQRRSRIKVGA